MINILEGQLTDILPYNLRGKNEVKALSEAIKEGQKMIYDYIKRCYIYAEIENVQEDILDELAIELKTPYYSQDLEREKKVELIRKTVKWHLTAGTPSAVEELLEIVFGYGEVIEWYEYGGQPYHFKVKTSASITEENIADFERMIDKVKNKRSHLDEVEIVRTVVADIGCVTYAKAWVKNSIVMEER